MITVHLSQYDLTVVVQVFFYHLVVCDQVRCSNNGSFLYMYSTLGFGQCHAIIICQTQFATMNAICAAPQPSICVYNYIVAKFHSTYIPMSAVIIGAVFDICIDNVVSSITESCSSAIT